MDDCSLGRTWTTTPYPLQISSLSDLGIGCERTRPTIVYGSPPRPSVQTPRPTGPGMTKTFQMQKFLRDWFFRLLFGRVGPQISKLSINNTSPDCLFRDVSPVSTSRSPRAPQNYKMADSHICISPFPPFNKSKSQKLSLPLPLLISWF